MYHGTVNRLSLQNAAMPKLITKIQRAETIRLRTEEQLSTPKIARRVGISNFSVYRILDGHAWIGPNVTKRTWMLDEIRLLERLWPIADEAEIVSALPGRKFAAIGRKASSLGLRRRMPGARNNTRHVHLIIKMLRDERERRGLTRPQLAAKIGYHWMQIHCWEMGKRRPIFNKLVDWAEGLEMEVIIRPVAHRVFDQKPMLPTKAQLQARRA